MGAKNEYGYLSETITLVGKLNGDSILSPAKISLNRTTVLRKKINFY